MLIGVALNFTTSLSPRDFLFPILRFLCCAHELKNLFLRAYGSTRQKNHTTCPLSGSGYVVMSSILTSLLILRRVLSLQTGGRGTLHCKHYTSIRAVFTMWTVAGCCVLVACIFYVLKEHVARSCSTNKDDRESQHESIDITAIRTMMLDVDGLEYACLYFISDHWSLLLVQLYPQLGHLPRHLSPIRFSLSTCCCTKWKYLLGHAIAGTYLLLALCCIPAALHFVLQVPSSHCRDEFGRWSVVAWTPHLACTFDAHRHCLIS